MIRIPAYLLEQLSGGLSKMEISFFSRSVSGQDIIERLRHSTAAEVISVWGADVSRLEGVCDIRKGGSKAIGFCAALDLDHCEEHLSGCLIITQGSAQAANLRNCYVQVDDARGGLIRLLMDLLRENEILPYTSIMSPEVTIAGSANIHPSAVVEPGVRIEDDVVISAGCVIKTGTQIGRGSVIRENTVIGCNGIIVYRSLHGERLKFPHLCGVMIGSDVEIGSNCVIPRGVLGSTRIGDGVIIGNLSNIGHGATVEDNVWMSVGNLIGGHSLIGAGATLGMGVRVRDNRHVGGKASVGMGSVVVKDVEAGTSVFGNPAKRVPSLNTGPTR